MPEAALKEITKIADNSSYFFYGLLCNGALLVYLAKRILTAIDENTERGHSHESRLEKIESICQERHHKK